MALKLIKPAERFPPYNANVIRHLAESLYLQYCDEQRNRGAPAPIWSGHEDDWIAVANAAYTILAVLGGAALQAIPEPKAGAR